MPHSIESLLADLTKEVRVNTEGYIRLETTLKSELEALRSDSSEFKETINILARTQANHSERLVASETRISDLQELRRDLSTLHADHRSLEAQVVANAPIKTPWTAIVSATVALGALMYAIFGK